MLVDDHARDSQPQAASRAVSATGVRCVFFEDTLQMFRWDGCSGVLDIDAIGVGSGSEAPASLRACGHRGFRHAAFPEIGITAHVDNSSFGSELTGVIENIDQDLFDLTALETKGKTAGSHIHPNCDALIVGKGRNFVESLFQTFTDIARLQVGMPFDMTSHA